MSSYNFSLMEHVHLGDDPLVLGRRDFGRGIYNRIFWSLKSQCTIFGEIEAALELVGTPSPGDVSAVATFRNAIVEFNDLAYSRLFEVTDMISAAVKDSLLVSLSKPVERIGFRILMICVQFNRIRSLLASTSIDCDDKLEGTTGDFFQQDDGTTIICRVCEKQIPLDCVETHSISCAIAHESTHVIKVASDGITRLIAREGKDLLKRACPGESDVIDEVLPVLHIVVLLGMAAASTCSMEMAKIDDRLRAINIGSISLDAVDLLQKATKLVGRKRVARARLSAAMDVVKTTVAPGDDATVSKTYISEFKFVKKISSGAFAKVFLAQKKKTSDIYAIKAIPKDRTVQKNEIDSVITERDILRRFSSPHIIRFFYSIIGRKCLYLVMEYMPGGDLFSVLSTVGSFEERHVRQYTAEIVVALEFLRKNGIVHRDMKPDNVLVDRDGHLKLADFGLSFDGMVHRAVDANRPEKKAVGTPDYMAPEIVWQQQHSFAADYWSLGCMVYEFMTGIPPFASDSPQETFQRVVKGEFDRESLHAISEEGQDFVTKLLCNDQFSRLGAKSISEIKDHPWFSVIDWDKLDETEPPFIPELSNAFDTSYFEERYEFRDDDDCDIIEDIRTDCPSKTVSDSSDENDIASFPATSVDTLRDVTIEHAKRVRRARHSRCSLDAASCDALTRHVRIHTGLPPTPLVALDPIPRSPSLEVDMFRASSCDQLFGVDSSSGS